MALFRKRVKVKYFADVTPIEAIEQGDWIDLRVAEDVTLAEGEFKIVPLGVGMILPKGYEAYIAPRSSAFKHYGVLMVNSPGVIDNAYCGNEDEWKIPLLAMRDTFIPKNDRVCQFRIQKKMPKFRFKKVDAMKEASRNGFGSTGSN